MKKTLCYFLMLIVCFHISSCINLNQGWRSLEKKEKSFNTNDLMTSIRKHEENAETKEEIIQLIEEYKLFLKSDYNYSTLTKLGNYYMLLGAGHSINKSEKKANFKEAIKYLEMAMLTNENFKQAMSMNKDVSSNSSRLTINELDAMGYWYTTRFYYYKECLTPLTRVFNNRIVVENNDFIKQIDKLDSTWSGGGNYFARGIYYISTPKRFGGSLEKAESEFSTAIEVGPKYLSNRWGRAKYLYSLTKNTEGYTSDLEWVISQNPHNSSIPYGWNKYFQNDAKIMLESHIR